MNLPNPFPGNPSFNTGAYYITPSPQNQSFKVNKSGTNESIVAIVLDESGSMNRIRAETIDGLNIIINENKKDKIKTDFILTRFSTYVKLSEITPIEHVPEIDSQTYIPLGYTSLLDGIGMTIEQISKYLEEFDINNRPSVVLTIITDGEENHSKKYKIEDIKNLIKAAEAGDWVISFLGANVDSFSVSESLGINPLATSNFGYNTAKDTLEVATSSILRSKSARSMGVDINNLYASASIYTDEEKRRMTGENK